MTQLQVNKGDLGTTRVVGQGHVPTTIGDGEILVRVEKFGFSANNVTYGVAGDTLGYWQFFPPIKGDGAEWGVIPVWGFGEVIASNVAALAEGERLFGYFPPATQFVMHPADITADSFFDAAAHRSELPKGYNLYRRVAAEPGYDPGNDDLRMLLYPLYITGFAIWDLLRENHWYGAEQVVIISASSKTSIGLAYALGADDNAPPAVGLTSAGNAGFVGSLGIYGSTATYDDLETSVQKKPSAIVDMAGNADVLGRLHAHLGDDMVKTLNVGLTHWESQGRDDRVIRERSEFFFAPAQIQKRLKEWGPEVFNAKSAGFVQDAATASSRWLKLVRLGGLEALEDIYPQVLNGTAKPDLGFVVDM